MNPENPLDELYARQGDDTIGSSGFVQAGGKLCRNGTKMPDSDSAPRHKKIKVAALVGL
jgi:hypothetical protein